MIAVTIIAVGKLGEKHFTMACDEYIKRLGGFCKLRVIEVDEARLPQKPSPGEIKKALEAEARSILEKLPPRCYISAMCIEGSQLSSEEVAAIFENVQQEYSHIAFIIGGSHGLDDIVKEKARLKLSMSRMTFPHQLARVMLLEQIYRGFSILGNRGYHK